MTEEEIPTGPDFTKIIMEASTGAIVDADWSNYEIRITFKGRKLCRGFQMQDLKIVSKRRRHHE